MFPITRDVDDATLAKLRETATQRNMSQSQFFSDLISAATGSLWPVEALALMGSVPDFPICEGWGRVSPLATRASLLDSSCSAIEMQERCPDALTRSVWHAVRSQCQEFDPMKFNVTIDRDEDGIWIVECPAIPGCVSQGTSKDEALLSMAEAIKLCLEVRAEQGLALTVETRQIEVAA